MNNWKELVGYQPLQSQDSKLYYLTCKFENGLHSFVIESQVVVCDFDEETLIEKLNEIFDSFTTKVTNSQIQIEKAKVHVARRSLRGIANTQWGNAIYYKGQQGPHLATSQVDVPVIVGEFEGKYGILVHPKFDDYGFIVLDN